MTNIDDIVEILEKTRKYCQTVSFYESQYYMFSNFSSFMVEYDNREWMTSEHAYQAMKFADLETQELIRSQKSAHNAKKIAQFLGKHVRSDWDSIKLNIMYEICYAKTSQHPYIKKKLMETGWGNIEEDSPTDTYWGVGSDRNGQNNLGKIWMQIREQLRSEITTERLKNMTLEEILEQFPKKGFKLKTKSEFPQFFYPHYTDMVEDAKLNLKPNTEYTVEKCEVYSSWCAVWLKEIESTENRKDRFFNLAYFKWSY